ncbi:hypothetical protein F5Y05DRAFT_417930 [Hypoxylon sp. FL0543]|nr:hypothetical protein F5Y05DRAFT_417930 [Hypoxylon sp. FL0543]
MSAQIDLGGGLLRTLPAELIREIGIRLGTPTEMVNFAHVCSQTYVMGLTELANADVECQLKTEIHVGHDWDRYMRRDLDPDTLTLRHRIYRRTRVPLDLHRPILLWAIESGKDIDYIKKCINIYQKHMPAGLRGSWFPRRCECSYKRELSEIEAEFPSPMFAAAKAGRLDVIQTLLDCNIDMRGRLDNACDYKDDLSDDYYYFRRMVAPPYIDRDEWRFLRKVVKGDNAFAAACEFHEDIALFMIANGLEVRRTDIWFAIKFGCFKVLETLLGHPVFNGDDRSELLLLLRRWATSKFVANPEIILPLLDAVTDPDFDGVEFLRERTFEILEGETLTEEDAFKASQLFELYVSCATPPFRESGIARKAARNDGLLNIVENILEEDVWSIDEPREEFMGSILENAVACGSVRIAKYLISLGCEFPASAHLGATLRVAVEPLGVTVKYT